MRSKNRSSLGLQALAIVCVLANVSIHAQAQSAAPAVSTSSTSSESATRSPWGFNIKNELYGPTVSQLDGITGPGSNVINKSSFRLGYRLPLGFTVEAVPILEFRSENKRRPEMFEFTDPYAALKKSDIFNTKRFGFDLAGELRYYAPVSNENARDIGTVRDRGRGRSQVRLIYTQQFFSGDLEFVSDLNHRRNYAERPQLKGVRDIFEVYNFLNYRLTANVTPYLSYINIVNRNRNGLGDPWVKNHTVGVGAKWQATRGLSLDPSLSSPFNSKDTQLRLETVYRFI